MIRKFYEMDHLKIVSRKIGGKVSGYPFYVLSIGNKKGVTNVVRHCEYLLQGHKFEQLQNFLQNSKLFSSVMLSNHCERFEFISRYR